MVKSAEGATVTRVYIILGSHIDIGEIGEIGETDCLGCYGVLYSLANTHQLFWYGSFWGCTASWSCLYSEGDRCSASIGWSVVIHELVTLTEMLYRPTLFDIPIVCSWEVDARRKSRAFPIFHLLYTTCTARAVIYFLVYVDFYIFYNCSLPLPYFTFRSHRSLQTDTRWGSYVFMAPLVTST